MRFFKTVFIVLLSIALNINDVLAFNNAIALEKGVTLRSCAALTTALSSGVGDLKGQLGINPGNLNLGNINPVATLESAVLHGAVGCVGSSLSGQSCGSGFVSGSISDLANVVSTGNTASDLLLHAVIGGTASQLSGGDFATGALNASLAEMFNFLSHPQAQQLQTANQALAGCQLSGTCDAQTVAKLQAQVNQLESLDATTNANLSLDCANGLSLACFKTLVDVQKANATYNPLGSYFDGTDSQLAANLRAENASASGLGGFLLSFAASLTLHPEILLALPASAPEAALGEAVIPTTLVRVVPSEFAEASTLGAPSALDVFVTSANDIAGINSSSALAQRLTLLDSEGNLIQGPLAIIQFDTPASGLASPVFRSNLGFISGGKTAGGATEYVLPNLRINQLNNVKITILPP